MSADWSDLDAALERYTPTFWWRDDDCIAHTPQLDRLLALASTVDAPLTLAVIPAHVADGLAKSIEGKPVTVATHGWSHTNHAPSDQKKAEFGAHRPLTVLNDEAVKGKTKLDQLFGAQSLPLFIPPWNRMAPELPSGLAGGGFKALSTFAQREVTYDPITRFDAHIDPIDWRGTRSAVPMQALIDHVTGLMASDEPIGLMTHHLVHDDAIWDLTEALVTHVKHAGAKWISATELMTRPPEKTGLG